MYYKNPIRHGFTNSMRKLTVICIFITQVLLLQAQTRVSIYELGDSITDFNTNFKNLLANWTVDNIANANSYELVNYSCIDTISDSTSFNYYRNYFSGIEPIFSSISHRSHTNTNGKKVSEFYIKPGFIHNEIFDQRGLPPAIRELFSEEFKLQAQDILTRDFNIDTTSLYRYYYEENTIDTMITLRGHFVGYGIEKRGVILNTVSPDSISKNYIDVIIKKEKSFDELTSNEKRSLLLEQLLTERTSKQLMFNRAIKIGDKVFVIDFIYKDKRYRNYVICNAENKKVILDYFFSGIMLEPKNN